MKSEPPRSRPLEPKSVTLQGIAGSPGVAIGTAVVLDKTTAAFPRRHIGFEEIADELSRFSQAVERTQSDLREMAKLMAGKRAEASILEAYLLMVGDETLAEAVSARVVEEQRCAEWAVALACEEIAGRLSQVPDPYLRERSHDVEFVGERLLRAMGWGRQEHTLPKLEGPTIVVAHDLSPADTASMINEPVVGLITEVGTRTSHTAIMARALEIPAVVGVGDALRRISQGDTLVLDGMRGSIILHPTHADLIEGKSRAERRLAHAKDLSEMRDRSPLTKDGTRVVLRANVELPSEALLARRHGADGIGLYRTEYLYIDRKEPPSEDEQFEIFRSVVELMAPHPVVLRTFDIGGDKFVSTFPVPPEMNPMLGLRAVRLALSRPHVFLEHLRAMVRASAMGDVRIMIPMVSSLGELREVQKLLDRAKAEVRARGLPCADEIPLGVMIEVPSAAIMVDLFAQEAAFLSLGTNDLIQYALAVDRTSRSLAYLASPFDPAILRLTVGVIRAGQSCKRSVSVCGAMGGEPMTALLLLGLGMREFSMEAAAIPTIKEALRRVTLQEAESVAAKAMTCSTAEDVEHCVASAFAPRIYDLLTGEDRRSASR